MLAVINNDNIASMATWRRNGYVIRSYKNDHAPLHVHVFVVAREIGRFDLESLTWMDPVPANHAGRARDAILDALNLRKKD